MPDPIRILADIPADSPGLGFADYVSALGDAVRGAEPAQLTIGLYGAWGSGKSTLLEALARDLSTNDDVLVVRFDAWRYERANHIVIPLLHAVTSAGASAKRFLPTTRQLKKFMRALMGSFSFSTPFGVTVDGQQLAEAAIPNGERSLDELFTQPFIELKGVENTLTTNRIVVLVDDLDRCSPDKVVSLLEAINLIMDIKGFIFVLALDYEVLVAAVSHKYPHVSGHAFIEKMIQLPFRVPPLASSSPALMSDLIPDWQHFTATHSKKVAETVVEVARIALQGNPRQIKRLINYVLLLERIIELRELNILGENLVALIGLQLAWPDQYRRLQEQASLDPTDAISMLLEQEDPRLSALARRHLTFADSTALITALQLTSAVESAPEPAAPEPSKDIPLSRGGTAPFRQSPRELLRAAGWRMVPQSVATASHPKSDLYSPTLYFTHPDLPEHEVSMGAGRLILQRAPIVGSARKNSAEVIDSVVLSQPIANAERFVRDLVKQHAATLANKADLSNQ